jgi:hypothetical protein
MNSVTRRTAIGVLACALAFPAMARDTREAVKLAPGKSSARINSVVTGNSVTEYTLGAKRGQVLSVTLSGGRSTTYFNVMPPGGDGSAMFNGSSEGNSFSATLPRDGTYLVTVYRMVLRRIPGPLRPSRSISRSRAHHRQRRSHRPAAAGGLKAAMPRSPDSRPETR